MDRKPRCPDVRGGSFAYRDEVYYHPEMCTLNDKPCLLTGGYECEVYQDYLKWLEGEEDGEDLV